MDLVPVLLLTTAIVLGAFEAWAYFTGSTATISRKVVDWTIQYPLLPFFVGLAFGLAAGHFWPVWRG